MVAVLVRLKLTLLRNGLRRSVWRTVGLVLALVYGLGVVVAVVVGLTALRFTSLALTADVTVLAFSLLTAGWLGFSVLLFGVDETLDPSTFALLPLRARELVPGLFVTALLGVPGLATVAVCAGFVVAWSRSPVVLLACLPACLLGVATSVLLARFATAALARKLAARRAREVAVVVSVLLGFGVAVGANLLGSLADADLAALRRALADTAWVAGWTPFGWAWAIPADVARRAWPQGLVHLLAAAGLVVALWTGWVHVLARRLVEPATLPERSGHAVSSAGWIDRLYPETPTGAVARRCLAYWRRDSRYLSSYGGLLVIPVVLLAPQVLSRQGVGVGPYLAAPLLALLAGSTIAGELSFDGSAVWLHVSSGVRGVEDRAGRLLAIATVIAVPLLGVLAVSLVLVGPRVSWPGLAGVTLSLALTGLGAGALVGAWWQWPSPPPGTNPFRQGSSGGLPGLLSFSVTSSAAVVVSLPAAALATGSYWVPWLGWPALLIGLVGGAFALRLGMRRGGRLLDRRWPEVLAAVGER